MGRVPPFPIEPKGVGKMTKENRTPSRTRPCPRTSPVIQETSVNSLFAQPVDPDQLHPRPAPRGVLLPEAPGDSRTGRNLITGGSPRP